MRGLVLSALALLLLSSAAQASRITGGQLHEQCVAGESSRFYQGTCAGYIAGVLDAHNMSVATGHMQRPYLCSDRPIKRGEYISTVTEYLKAHPEQHHLGAASLVWIALVSKYVCTGKAAEN